MATHSAYPLLTDFMEKFLFQLAAPTFEEAVAAYGLNGAQEVRALVDEIDRVLANVSDEAELSEYVARHSDYMTGTGKETLGAAKEILSAWLAKTQAI